MRELAYTQTLQVTVNTREATHESMDIPASRRAMLAILKRAAKVAGVELDAVTSLQVVWGCRPENKCAPGLVGGCISCSQAPYSHASGNSARETGNEELKWQIRIVL